MDLEEINRIREEVLTPLAAFREGLRSGPCTVRRATESLRNLMENWRMRKSFMQKKAEALEAAGDLAHAVRSLPASWNVYWHCLTRRIN